MKESKLKLAKPDIQSYIKNYKSNVFKTSDIINIFISNKDTWRLNKSDSPKKFINFLINENVLELIDLNFPHLKFTRYKKNNASIFELFGSLKRGSYFSHYSAVYIHELTEQIPKTIYVNIEQPEKPRSKLPLNQINIDKAFSKPWRMSNNKVQFNDYNIYILSGMSTGNLGVKQLVGPNGENIRVTDIERTLIDITVRPIYSGGVFEVLKAYRNSLAKIDLSKLLKYLVKINYLYPYHQAVGYYLEKAGYTPSQLEIFRNIGLGYDFYLTHQIKNIKYSKKWRLYYPDGF